MPEAAADPALLDAASRAFERYGYAGASLERIAAEAGLSRVTLHRREVSKDGLLAGLVSRAVEDYRRLLWPALTGEGSGAERLEEALGALCDAAEQNLALLVALRAQSDLAFHQPGEDEAMTRAVFTEPLQRLLRDGVADGSLRQLDADETATVLFNLIGWTYVHMRSGHDWKAERAKAAVLDPVLNGLLAERREQTG
jgi:AcrR family transcriptional regulator